MKSRISSEGSATLSLECSITLRLDGSQSKIVDGSASLETWQLKAGGLY